MWILNLKKVPSHNNTQTFFLIPYGTLVEKYSFEKYYNLLESIEKIFGLKWICFVISLFLGFNNCNWALIPFSLWKTMCYKITSNWSWPQIASIFLKIL
jgi:hypothetical protein